MPLSFSQLNLYRTCPRQYEFANVKKLERKISAGESFGSSVHNTLKKFGERELVIGNSKSEIGGQTSLFGETEEANNQLPSTNTLLAYWHSSFIVDGYASREEADAARRKGEKMMQDYFEWWLKEDHEPVIIEKGFSLAIDDLTITGRFDRVERCDGGLRVIDYKTSKVREQSDVDQDLQLSIYALAVEQELGEPCKELMLLFLREDGIIERVTHRSSEQLEEAKKIIKENAERIEERAFDPTPSVEVCGRCPYRNVCDAALVSRI